MTSAFESAINEVLADIEKHRQGMAHMHESMREINGTARSKRRQVSAIVDSRGELLELTFHGTGYRNLAPAELADIIVSTVREARASATEQLYDSLEEAMPGGAALAEAAKSADWSTLMSEGMKLPQPLLDLLGSSSSGLLNDEQANKMFNAFLKIAEQDEDESTGNQDEKP